MTARRPWIAYAGPMAFPEGGAAARRILGNAKALVAAGYDIVVVSGQPQGPQREAFDVAPGIQCVSLNERNAEHMPRALRYIRYALMGARTRKWLAAQSPPPAAVLLYSGYSPYLLQLTGWARRRSIPLMFDAVEWYTAPSVAGFLFSPYLWNIELAMRVLVPRLDGIIAISKSLEQYYATRGCRVTRVPPLFDPEEITCSTQRRDFKAPLRLVYSGSPGQKDLLDIVLDTVISLHQGGRSLTLDVVGLTETEVNGWMRAKAPATGRSGCIRAHGRVSHKRSLEIVQNADFSVFIRHVNRVSTNGFPTKFVESLALGTPVITNLTSDLSDHLHDAENGLVCNGPTQSALEHAIDRALMLNGSQQQTMRLRAREEAERSFAWQIHATSLGAIIQDSRQSTRCKKEEA